MQPEPAGHAHQHRVLVRVDVSVGGYRHELQLQEELHQGTTAAADAGKRVDRGVEIEIGLLAAGKSGLCLLALLATEPEHLERALHRLDLVAGDDAVGLAERAHDAECRVDELGLHDAQTAHHRLPEREACAVADEAADNGAWQGAEDCADDGADDNEKHSLNMRAAVPGLTPNARTPLV